MRAMAGINALPTYDATATIGGSVGRSVQRVFGGVTPIFAHGDKIPEILRQPVPILGADLIPRADYGIRPPALRQPVPILGADLIPRADYGIRPPAGLFGLPLYTGPLLGAKLLDRNC